MDSNNNYKVVADYENEEAIVLIGKAMELFTDIAEEHNIAKAKYDEARYKLEKMFAKGNEEFGLKSVKSAYASVTYVPATDGKIVKKLNESKAIAILKELGIDEEEYMDINVTGKRKESIRVGVE